jgi:hypothetical protein
MASGDELDLDALHDDNEDNPGAKRRRLYGACDMCRKKKSAYFEIVNYSLLNSWAAVRCELRKYFQESSMPISSSGDSSVMPGNQCSNCAIVGSKCEHTPRRTKVSTYIFAPFRRKYILETGTRA